MRTAVVLPAPLGPSTPSTVPARSGEVDAVQRERLAEALGEPVGLDREVVRGGHGSTVGGALAARSHGAHMGSHGARATAVQWCAAVSERLTEEGSGSGCGAGRQSMSAG